MLETSRVSIIIIFTIFLIVLEKPKIEGEAKKTLMTDKEFDDFMASEGKSYSWNNYFTEVDKKTGKEYRGHWTKDR